MIRAARSAAVLCFVALTAAAPPVRRLNVLIVLYTHSFARTLTPAQIARVHEEVAEFYDFYQTHGRGKVDFDFSVLQVDRELRRREVGEVAPGKYYLSRENVEGDLRARGIRPGQYDEVIALYAWNNANPDAAMLAYGGGAVGPDGKFLGDAGFNSIGLFAWDIERVGQILIHEVLHNVDDMFARSGMPDAFFNADEMSRNMPTLLAERPGAFLPRFDDREMLAYAERERAGRASYPWAMQLVYYGWMLERTPKADWDRLHFGRMVPARAPHETARALYSRIMLPAGDDSTFVPALGPDARAVMVAGRCTPLAALRYEQVDFDGAPVYGGPYQGAWVRLPPHDADAMLAIAPRCGARAGAGAAVQRTSAAWVDAPDSLEVAYPGDAALHVVVRRAEQGRERPAAAAGASLTASAGATALPVSPRGDGFDVALGALGSGTHRIALAASAAGVVVHGETTLVTRAPSWGLVAERRPEGPMMAPIAVTVDVRERAPVAATVRAAVRGRRVPLVPLAGGRYTVNLDSLPPGLDTVVVTAVRDGGAAVTDTLTAWVQPWGYLRVPDELRGGADGTAELTVRVRSRMGAFTRGLALPLVAVVGGRAIPLTEDDAGVYRARIPADSGEGRATVLSLIGNFPTRVVLLRGGRVGTTALAAQSERTPDGTEFAVAPRADIVVDGRLDDWRGVPALSSERWATLDSTRGDDTGPRAAAEVRLAWNDSTLFLAASVDDDSVTAGDAWDTDRLNFVFDMAGDDSPVSYPTASPAMDTWQADDYWVYVRPFGAGGKPGSATLAGRAGHVPLAGARVAAVRRAGGWDVEAAIPRAELPGFRPFVGAVAGLQLFLTDGDGGGRVRELMWHGRWPYGSDGIEFHLMQLGRLVFAGDAR